MKDTFELNDALIGGMGLAAGIALTLLFESNQTGGCGCGGHQVAAPLPLPPQATDAKTFERLQNVKQVGPAITSPDTMGGLAKDGCRRWKSWHTNDYGIPQQYQFADCGGGTYVLINGHGWQLLN